MCHAELPELAQVGAPLGLRQREDVDDVRQRRRRVQRGGDGRVGEHARDEAAVHGEQALDAHQPRRLDRRSHVDDAHRPVAATLYREDEVVVRGPREVLDQAVHWLVEDEEAAPHVVHFKGALQSAPARADGNEVAADRAAVDAAFAPIDFVRREADRVVAHA